MITLILAITFVLLVASKASAKSPVALTEHSARVLIWVDTHPKAGTKASRAWVRRQHMKRIWRGLNMAGVVNNFYCIHRYEQPSWYAVAWPYTGGLSLSEGYIRQFAPDFLRAWGWANNWPIAIQIVAGYRAVWQGYGYFALDEPGGDVGSDVTPPEMVYAHYRTLADKRGEALHDAQERIRELEQHAKEQAARFDAEIQKLEQELADEQQRAIELSDALDYLHGHDAPENFIAKRKGMPPSTQVLTSKVP